MKSLCCLALAVCIAAGAHAQPLPEGEQVYDVLIRGGRILDGTGNPWFRADVAILEGRIAAIGTLLEAQARQEIDATGLVLVPGFIDIHSHADDSRYGSTGLRSVDARRRAAPSLVMQGITTVVVNQDGRMPEGGLRRQRAVHDSLGIGPNAALMAGHNAIRRTVMGTDYRRPATASEIAQMRELLLREMEDGAFGLSSGLEYVPGRWSTTDELVALVSAIAPLGGVYIAHQRSEAISPMWWRPSEHGDDAPTLFDALRETIEIGERTGATVVASHFKAKGVDYWGRSVEAVALVEDARARGVSIYADQYPYTTSGTDGNVVLIPNWATRGDGGARESLKRVLADSLQYAALRRDIAHTMRYRGGAEQIFVFEYPDTTLAGMSLVDAARRLLTDPVSLAVKFQLEGFEERPGGVRLRGFSMSETDLELIAAQPWVATASDGGIAVDTDTTNVHIRFYGTFPRKIRRYALEREVLSVSDAVRSATSLPAQILGLRHRGLIREGYVADIAVLDLENIGERASFTEPHQYAKGVEYVLVSGEFVVDSGQPTWALPGRSLVRLSSPD